MATPLGTNPASVGGRDRVQVVVLGVISVLAVLLSFRLAVSGGGMTALGAVAGAVVAALVFRRPSIGILIYLTTFLLTYPAFLRGAGNLTVNNLLGVMLFPTMLYGMLRDGDWWLLKHGPLLLLGAVVILMIGASIYYTPASEIAREMMVAKIQASQRAQGAALISTRDEGIKFLTRFVFLVFFVFFIRTPRDLKWVIGILVAVLVITYCSVSTEAGPLGWGTGRLRVMGKTGFGVYAGRNPNKLAYFSLLGLTLLWYSRRAIRSRLMYPGWLACLAITFIMIPMTGSRSGLLNLLLFMAIVLLEGRFNYRKIIGLGIVATLLIVQIGFDVSVVDLMFPERVASRLTQFEVRTEALEMGAAGTGSTGGRIRTIQAALRIFTLHPLVGVGIGNFNTERSVTDPFGTVGPPHNSYLWALAESGIIGFTLYMVFFYLVWRGIREIRWEYEARFGAVGLGWLVDALRTILIGFMFFSFFADMWHHVLFYIVMGLALATIRIHQVYAETGQVPVAFRVGKPLEAVGLDLKR